MRVQATVPEASARPGCLPRDLVMRLGLRHMARTGNDPSRWSCDHRIEWAPPSAADGAGNASARG